MATVDKDLVFPLSMADARCEEDLLLTRFLTTAADPISPVQAGVVNYNTGATIPRRPQGDAPASLRNAAPPRNETVPNASGYQEYVLPDPESDTTGWDEQKLAAEVDNWFSMEMAASLTDQEQAVFSVSSASSTANKAEQSLQEASAKTLQSRRPNSSREINQYKQARAAVLRRKNRQLLQELARVAGCVYQNNTEEMTLNSALLAYRSMDSRIKELQEQLRARGVYHRELHSALPEILPSPSPCSCPSCLQKEANALSLQVPPHQQQLALPQQQPAVPVCSCRQRRYEFYQLISQASPRYWLEGHFKHSPLSWLGCPAAVLIFRCADCIVLDANMCAEGLVKRKRRKLIGSSAYPIFVKRDSDQGRLLADAALRLGRGSWEHAATVIQHGGACVMRRLIGSFLMGADGRPYAFMIVLLEAG